MDDYQRLLQVLHDAVEDVDFEHEEALVEDGVIDSLDITVLIAALDEAFNVHITTADIEPENFNSAKAMLHLIQRHREAL